MVKVKSIGDLCAYVSLLGYNNAEGCVETVVVLGVDGEYINLSKWSKLVHSVMRHVAETTGVDLEDLYIHVGWPLYRKYGHVAISGEVKAALVKDIKRRMTPHPLKINVAGDDDDEGSPDGWPSIKIYDDDALMSTHYMRSSDHADTITIT